MLPYFCHAIASAAGTNAAAFGFDRVGALRCLITREPACPLFFLVNTVLLQIRSKSTTDFVRRGWDRI